VHEGSAPRFDSYKYSIAGVPRVDLAPFTAAGTGAVDLPDDVLRYTLPSRYVVPDLLVDKTWRPCLGGRLGT
jgi:hypothetical protein